jgi:4-amino-4-deoxy-L-arabinose transferase-like glycosyltransferase
MSAPPETENRRADAVVVALSMAACLMVQWIYGHRVNPSLLPDAPRYLFIAESMARGDWRHALHFHYPPLFPAWISLFLPFFRSAETAGRVAEAAIAALTVPAVFFLARLCFNRAAAWCAALLFPFKFFTLYLGVHAEPPLNFLIFSALALGIAGLRERRTGWLFLAGLAFGLGFLAKSEAQAFFLAWWGMGFLFLAISRHPARKTAKMLAVAVAGYLLIVSPYLAAYARQTGRFSLNPKLHSLFILHNEPDWADKYRLRRDERGYYTIRQRVEEGDRLPPAESLSAYFWRNRARIVPVYFDRQRFSLTQIVPAYFASLLPWLGGWLAAALLLAGIGAPGPGRGMPRLLLLGFAIVPLLTVPWFWPDMRFFSSLIPLLVILLAGGMEAMVRLPFALVKLWRGRIGLAKGIALALALGLIVPDLTALARYPREQDFWNMVEDRKLIADWLKAHVPAGQSFMSSGTYMPYWYLAGWPPEADVVLPLTSLDQTLEYARQENCACLVVSSSDLNTYLSLRPLLSPDFTHPRLKYAFSTPPLHGVVYYIYWIK